ncbi:MAG: hypothetical protein ACTHJ5_08570 [Ilyomonas sp.]
MIPTAVFHGIFVASQSVHLLITMASGNCRSTKMDESIIIQALSSWGLELSVFVKRLTIAKSC